MDRCEQIWRKLGELHEGEQTTMLNIMTRMHRAGLSGFAMIDASKLVEWAVHHKLLRSDPDRQPMGYIATGKNLEGVGTDGEIGKGKSPPPKPFTSHPRFLELQKQVEELARRAKEQNEARKRAENELDLAKAECRRLERELAEVHEQLAHASSAQNNATAAQSDPPEQDPVVPLAQPQDVQKIIQAAANDSAPVGAAAKTAKALKKTKNKKEKKPGRGTYFAQHPEDLEKVLCVYGKLSEKHGEAVPYDELREEVARELHWEQDSGVQQGRRLVALRFCGIFAAETDPNGAKKWKLIDQPVSDPQKPVVEVPAQEVKATQSSQQSRFSVTCQRAADLRGSLAARVAVLQTVSQLSERDGWADVTEFVKRARIGFSMPDTVKDADIVRVFGMFEAGGEVQRERTAKGWRVRLTDQGQGWLSRQSN